MTPDTQAAIEAVRMALEANPELTEHPWHWHADPVKGDPLGRSRYEVVTLGRTITRTYYTDEVALTEAAWIAAASPANVSLLLAALDEATQWRPIETAPKDGTRVDLWACPHDMGSRTPQAGRITDACWEAGAWRMPSFMSDGSPGPEIDMRVTHWKPLPTPPLATKGPEA